MTAARILLNKDPKDTNPEQYRFLLRLYLEQYHMDDIEKIILLEVGPDEHLSFPIHAHNFIDYDPALSYTVLHYPKLLLPIFEEAIHEAQLRLYNNPKVYEKNNKKGCIKRNCHIRIYSLPPTLDLTKSKLEDISADEVDGLIQFAGTIVKTGSVRMLEVSKVYECQNRKCMNKFTVVSDPEQDNIIVQPTVCPGFDFNGKCKSTNLIEIEGSSVCVDYQEIKIQDQMERMALGCSPRSMILVMEADLVDSNNAGDDVVVVGTIIRRWRPVIRGTRCIVDLAVRVNSIRSLNAQEKIKSIARDTFIQFENFWNKFKSENRCFSGRDVVLKSFCPQLYGLYHVKLSVLLTLIGGTEKKNENGNNVKTRCQSHLLVVGDPGCGKSQILRFITSIIPRAVLTTGIGTSGAGLTCTAVRDGQDWSIEAGAMLLANEGVCCIDEFASIREADRATIHEVMEQQTLSVAKAGLVMKLNTKTTVIACCNPKGSYDIHADITTNTAIGSPLLSRFDLILILIDTPQKEWDKRVSTFLLQNAIDAGLSKKLNYICDDNDDDDTNDQSTSLDNTSKKCHLGHISQDDDSTIDGNNNVNTKCWSIPILREYIAFVKYRFHPVMSEEAKILLMRYYQLQRQSEDRSSARTTVRLLESLMRLSEAHAKLMFRDEVLLEDAVIAIYLVSASQSLTSILEDYSNLQTDFPSSSEESYAEHEEKVFRLLHYDKKKLNEEIQNKKKMACNNNKNNDFDNSSKSDDINNDSKSNSNGSHIEPFSIRNEDQIKQLSNKQWKQIQDKQKVVAMATRVVDNVDENQIYNQNFSQYSIKSSSSLSLSSSPLSSHKKRHASFDFDNFKCQKTATIPTTTNATTCNATIPTTFNTDATTDIANNFNWIDDDDNNNNNNFDGINEDINANINSKFVVTSTVINNSNLVINTMKLKGFDTDDITIDDDW